MRPLTLAAVFVCSAIAGFVLLSDPHRGAYDFQAFYCAGSALRSASDPYRSQPLGSCEHRQTDGTYAALPPQVVLPAPQPGYDIALFAVLALLPFALAKAVWGALVAFSIAVAMLALLGAARAPPLVVVMALAASLVVPALGFGQLFAMFAAALCASMWFAGRRRWTAAGVAAALSLVQPHLGLPLCISMAIWKRESRPAIVLTAAALAVTSILAVGFARNVEYVTTILPLHAISEITSDAQLSLSAVLYAAGAPVRLAVLGGTISYVAAAVCGIACARVLAARSGDAAFLTAVPAAFATIGGTFIHVTEFSAAIPLALILASRKTAYHALFVAALTLLAVPWFTILEPGNTVALTVLGGLAVSYLVRENGSRRIVPALGAGALSVAVLALSASLTPVVLSATRSFVPIADRSYPQASWQAWNGERLSTGSAITWFLRGLSWSGDLLLAGGVIALVRQRNGLLVHELADPQAGELAPVSAPFDPAEG